MNLNVYRVIDQFGWAYHFVCKEHAKYSRHNIVAQKYDDVEYGADLFYVHSPDIATSFIKNVCQQTRELDIPMIGGYAGNPKYWNGIFQKTYDSANFIVTISPQTYVFAKEHYADLEIAFLPESVDTEFFVEQPFVDDRFVVGWAGGVHRPVKRSHLLKQLHYDVLTQTAWGKCHFAKERTQKHMLEFYSAIDVLVITSISECQPRVVMEAMSRGLPVVATDVGSMRMLLDGEWIVPVIPDYKAVSCMNRCLDKLKKDTKLRKAVGERNKEWIRKVFSWDINAWLWDDVFELVHDGRYKEARMLADGWLLEHDFMKYFNNTD